jgi:hypothetical protein
LFLGTFVILTTFLWEYTTLIIQGGFLSKIATLATDPSFAKIIAEHIPASFNWYLFMVGEGFIICYLIMFCWRTKDRAKVL